MQYRSLRNSRGAVLLITVVVIALILLSIVSMGAHQISLLSKESYRLNESLKYLNIMEEMGQIVATAYVKAQGGVAACSAGETRVTLVAQSGANKQICLPNAGVTGDVCINREATGGTLPEVYCLIPGTAAAPPGAPRPGLFFITQSEKEPVFIFQIEQKKEESLLAKMWNHLWDMRAVAMPLGEPWRQAQIPDPPPSASGPYTPPPADPATIADLGAIPGSGSLESTGGVYAGGGNMEPWRPTPSWTDTNEIYIPSCTNAGEERLGCINCNTAGVTCIEFRLCPPSNLACTDPYVQRIAVY